MKVKEKNSRYVPGFTAVFWGFSVEPKLVPSEVRRWWILSLISRIISLMSILLSVIEMQGSVEVWGLCQAGDGEETWGCSYFPLSMQSSHCSQCVLWYVYDMSRGVIPCRLSLSFIVFFFKRGKCHSQGACNTVNNLIILLGSRISTGVTFELGHNIKWKADGIIFSILATVWQTSRIKSV